jgi:DNA-binding response OmpR family regulator
VLDALRGKPSAPPVLVVSAKSAESDVDHALSLGASAYLAKPFNSQALLDAVEELVRSLTAPAT